MRVEYSSNNSGGYWWLSDEDWRELERCGWSVDWVADNPFHQDKRLPAGERFLGALATKAISPEVESEDAAIAWWERITGQNASDEGCECCGPPHSFHKPWLDDEEIARLDALHAQRTKGAE